MFEDEPGATTEQIAREEPFGDRVLLVIDGANLHITPLPGSGTLTIGRASRCDVVIDSASVSRHHGNLVIGSELEVEDVGSSNGTFVDGARLTPNRRAALAVGVPFVVGAVTLMVQNRSGAHREPTPHASKLAALEQTAARIVDGNVVVSGEHGVGRQRFAERLHEMSPRRAGSFVRINCSAIGEPELEAEMFGDAACGASGRLELASGGTALLVDADQLPPGLQHALLLAIERAAVRGRPVDVRYVASTTRPLAAEVEAGRFRRDLYVRLAGAAFAIPPLRERTDEVLPLAEQFIASAAGSFDHGFVLAEDAKRWLAAHDWPGNIRELRNACERAVLLATGTTIERRHLTVDDPSRPALGPRFRSSATIPPIPGRPRPSRSAADVPSQVRATVAELEKQRILEALDRCAGNQTRAAEILGISRRTLINRLDEYAIARPRKRDD